MTTRMFKVVLKSRAIVAVEAVEIRLYRRAVTGTLERIEFVYEDETAGQFEYLDVSQVDAITSEEI